MSYRIQKYCLLLQHIDYLQQIMQRINFLHKQCYENAKLSLLGRKSLNWTMNAAQYFQKVIVLAWILRNNIVEPYILIDEMIFFEM